MNQERNGTISVVRNYTREEMIKNFYGTKESLQELEKQILEGKAAIEQAKLNILAMEEQQKQLMWFLKESGAILDQGKK
jgi:hypothetical protein